MQELVCPHAQARPKHTQQRKDCNVSFELYIISNEINETNYWGKSAHTQIPRRSETENKLPIAQRVVT